MVTFWRYLGDVVGLVPDHHSIASLPTKRVGIFQQVEGAVKNATAVTRKEATKQGLPVVG